VKKLANLLIAAATSVTVSACTTGPTPLQRAARVARAQCLDPKVARDEPRILQETAVVRVQPVTFVSWSARQQGGWALGATKLYAIPPEGITAEEMARVIQCHSAKALLTDVNPAAFADDPFYLPDTWVDSDVKAEKGLYVVTVSAEKIWQNLVLLRRATAFANAHREVLSSF
jgi:hypothetical protein